MGRLNVLERNDALHPAATYGLRSHVDSLLTLTGDFRNIATTDGMENPRVSFAFSTNMERPHEAHWRHWSPAGTSAH